jgi:DnaJ family protein C protein 8
MSTTPSTNAEISKAKPTEKSTKAEEPKKPNVSNIEQFLTTLKKESKRSIKQEIRDSEKQIERLFSCVWKNPFDCLLLDRDATEDEIKKRYKLFSLALHPDKCSHEKTTEAFEIVKQAYQTLMSVEKRKIFQRIMREAFEKTMFERKLENNKRKKKGLGPLPEDTFDR